MEFDIIDTYETPFRSYLQYAKSLGVSLHNVFDTVADIDQRRSNSPPQTGQIQSPENESTAKMQEAIIILRDRNEPITKKAVSRIAQLSNATMSQLPSLGIELQQLVSAARAAQRQQAILEKNAIQRKVSETITQLELAGKPVRCHPESCVMVGSKKTWKLSLIKVDV